MNSSIMVSIIIPTYYRNESLKRAIDSVLNQTYKNIEVLVIDDNPPESGFRIQNIELMKSYQNETRVRYIQNERNIGGGPTRNHGIDEAQGEYIAFLDDDDVYMPERIQKQLKVFTDSQNDKLALVYCYAKFIYEDGNSYYSDRRNFHGNCLYEAMEQNCIAATSQWMVKRDIFKSVGCFPDVACKQDSQAILRLLKEGYEVEVIPEELSCYYNADIGQRISGLGRKNIQGEAEYRIECRKLYYLLEDWQILNIEYTFATKMYGYYQANKMKTEKKHEWKLMKRIKPREAYIFLLKRMWHKIKK